MNEKKSYKSEEFMSAGYFWAPYVITTEDVVIICEEPKKIMTVKEWLHYHRNKFIPRELISSRHTNQTVNPQFYGLVNVAGIKTE